MASSAFAQFNSPMSPNMALANVPIQHFNIEGKDVTCSMQRGLPIPGAVPEVRCLLPDGNEFKPHYGPIGTAAPVNTPSCSGRSKVKQAHGHLWWKRRDTFEQFTWRLIKSGPGSCGFVARYWQPIQHSLDLPPNEGFIVFNSGCFTEDKQLWNKPCNILTH